MNFNDLLESHPEILVDRTGLSFSRHDTDPAVDAYARSGAIVLRQALPASVLGEAAGRIERQIGAATGDSWHKPWDLHQGAAYPAAAVLAAVLRSWAWDVVEHICRSSRLVVILKWCTIRHTIDRQLGLGGHQDAKVVAPDVPFAMWIPLTPVGPRQASGLGYMTAAPDHLLPTAPNDDIGAAYLLDALDRLWVPTYDVGDLSIHSRYSPHFTTGFGTGRDRYSMEVRVMSRLDAPGAYTDPALHIARRGGKPTIVDRTGTPVEGLQAFFDSPDLAAVSA